MCAVLLAKRALSGLLFVIWMEINSVLKSCRHKWGSFSLVDLLQGEQKQSQTSWCCCLLCLIKKQKAEIVMTRYAEDIWVPVCRKWGMSEACYLMSEEGGKLSQVCLPPVGLCIVNKGGRSLKMSPRCRHPLLQTHSCVTRKRFFFHLRNVWVN